MRWFKHDTDANMDAKLQDVLLDYGLEGYGLYWYCLELISGKVDKNNITFQLEHDARIIARNTGSTPQKVQEMMTRFVDIGLFENTDGIITCIKLAKRLDQSMTSNKEMRFIIDTFKENHDGVMTASGNVMKEEKRLEEIRLEESIIDKKEKKTTRFIKPEVTDIALYMTERNWNDVDLSADRFFNHYESKGWKVGKSAMKDWKAAVRTWEKNNKPNEDYNDVPIQPIVKLYNDLLSAKTSYQVSVVSDQLKRDIAKRCRNSQNANNVQWWAQFFAACANRLNHIEPQFRPARYKLDRLVGRDFEEVLNEVNSN